MTGINCLYNEIRLLTKATQSDKDLSEKRSIEINEALEAVATTLAALKEKVAEVRLHDKDTGKPGNTRGAYCAATRLLYMQFANCV